MNGTSTAFVGMKRAVRRFRAFSGSGVLLGRETLHPQFYLFAALIAQFTVSLMLAENAFGSELSDCRKGTPRERVEACSSSMAVLFISRKTKIQALAYRADAYVQLGNLAAAQKDYSQIIELDANNYQAYLGRAHTTARTDGNRSLDDLNKAVALNNLKTIGYIRRAQQHVAMKNFQAALVDVAVAKEKEPSNFEVYLAAAAAFAGKKDRKNEMLELKKAISLQPDNPAAHVRMAEAYKSMGKSELAIRHFTLAINAGDDTPLTLIGRGDQHYESRNFKQAELDYGLALGALASLNPQNTSGHVSGLSLYTLASRGNARLLLGRWSDAADDFSSVIQSSTPESAPFGARAWTYFKMGKYPEAIADATKAVAERKLYPQAYHTRGVAYLAIDDHKSAIADFSVAIKQNPNFPLALHDRATAYEAIGNFTAALSDLKKAAELSGRAGNQDDQLAKRRASERLANLQIKLGKPAPVLNSDTNNAEIILLQKLPPLPTEAPIAPVPAVLAKEVDQAIAESSNNLKPVQRRVALVIGNAKYKNSEQFSNLANPARDAKAIADALRALGFAQVKELYNASREAMREGIKDLGELAGDADWAVVFFAGHGVQVGGAAYMVPSDGILAREKDAPDRLVDLMGVLDEVGAAKVLGLVVLDACRANASLTKRLRGSTSSIRSSFPPVEPFGNVLVAYSARHGTTADDGEPGRHSPFVVAMLEHLKTSRLDIRIMLGRVRDSVLQSTGRQQEPFTYGSLGGQLVYFNDSLPKSVRNN